MSRLDVRAGLALLLLLPGGMAAAQADRGRSPQEEQRRKLLKGMGLQKKESAPQPAPVPAPAPEPTAPDTSPQSPAAKGDGRTPATPVAPATPAAPSFRRAVHPLVVQGCKACHVAGGPAGGTRLVLSGDAAVDHPVVARLVDTRDAAGGTLLAKASGAAPHGGGATWPAGGVAHGRVLAWIRAGARLDGAGAAVAAAPVPAPATAGAAPRQGTRGPAAPAAGVVAAAPPEPSPSPSSAPAEAVASAPAEPAAAAVVAADAFPEVHGILMARCGACHGAKGMAAATRLVLAGTPERDRGAALALADLANPPASPLLTKAAGQLHGGGAVLAPDSAPYRQILAWITANVPAAVPSADVATPAGAAPAPAPAAAAPPPAVPAAAPVAGYHHGGGLALPYGFALNGRFDLNYERRGFTGSPGDEGAVNALRSYHRFLFLSRNSTDDPFGLTVEMLSLQFWEARVRIALPSRAMQLALAGGKIVVPFGAEPLLHQSYGGLVGFDQRMLPPIWAQEGITARFLYHRRALTITDELFVVRGYGLRQAEGILNLQNDFSPADDVKAGWGNRLGAAWGPVSAWYSAYYNGLGFGRRLFMQAADVTLWRMRGVPVLSHLSFAAGILRADVSGGGSGQDYYHFGSYFQVRLYPTEWLYLQYRQGVRTFNNRRGVVVDETRLTSEDGSTHNFGVVARWYGLSAGLFWFINLEKGPEVPDDFMRLSVAYDF